MPVTFVTLHHIYIPYFVALWKRDVGKPIKPQTTRSMIKTQTDATPRGAYRTFIAQDGCSWLVWRVSENTVEGLRKGGWSNRAWLVFLGPRGETKRTPAPNPWRRLSDHELGSLADVAVPFTAAVSC